jgi:hypothetical protein
MLADAGEGAMYITGCYFEKCITGFLTGVGPTGVSDCVGALVMAGCWFKNNSTAIWAKRSTAYCTFAGIRIEGTNGQAPSGLNPQYGILLDTQTGGGSPLLASLLGGITVVGQYDGAGIYISWQGPQSFPQISTFAGLQSVSWGFAAASPPNVFFPQLIACNQSIVYTVANLPTSPKVGDCYNVSDGTNGLSWGATVTNTGTHTTHYKVRYNGSNFTVMGQ